MGRPKIDLTGQKFGRLLVIEQDTTKPTGSGKPVYWKCKCECSNICSVRYDKLVNGEVRSCGCLSKEIRTALFLDDLTGKRFGKLEVIMRDPDMPHGKAIPAYWICQCDCGNMVTVRADHLKNGTTTSCGCINSKGEMIIKKILADNNIKFKSQVRFKDLRGKANSYLFFDFAIYNEDNSLKCLVEYQGLQHYQPYHFDSQERFEARQLSDQRKRDYCKQHNIKLFEIKYTDYDKLSFEYLKNKGII